MAYKFSEIESKWQAFWGANNTFKTDVLDKSKPKYYVLDMFPYPSGEGLHVGHPEGYTATDIVARYKRHCGYNVMHPMGWDAFGLPAETYAMKTNIHPAITTKKNTDTFRRQLQSIGFSYDWSKELNTTTPDYYKWTQWIFLKLYNSWFNYRTQKGENIAELVKIFETEGSANLIKPNTYANAQWDFSSQDWQNFSLLEQQKVLSNFRLAYEAMIPVNWCEALGTVLANEEVEEWTGKGYTVERRPMRQWMMRITQYAERLLDDLAMVDWPKSTLEMQINWIGKSIGAEITFDANIDSSHEQIKVFTTRADTLLGATFLTIAPEHKLVQILTTNSQKTSVEAYCRASQLKSERDRQATEEKTGVFTGSYAIHPITSQQVPIWVGDYVIGGYGTGAVMGVPAHDERDFLFAKKYSLEVKTVIAPKETHEHYTAILSGEVCYTDPGTLINSGEFDGTESNAAKEKIIDFLAQANSGRAKKTIQYKLRDWLFARQKYWGEPIPLINYQNGITLALSESELPLILPEMQEFKPSGTGESPLVLAKDWLIVNDETHGIGHRETNTMPQWAGSCWYYLRFLDCNNSEQFVNPEIEKHWLPVDLYIGGSEHATLHLLYARFWHKVLYDLGFVSTKEPFKKLVHQGLILGEDSQKMSKSRGNVINPDEVINAYGADSLRLYEMFLGPLEMSKPWSTQGIEGVSRFLKRAYRMIAGDSDTNYVSKIEARAMSADEEKTLHKTIAKVTEDIENLRFNTAISALMVFVNEFINLETKPQQAMQDFCVLLSPFAPHLAEELHNIIQEKCYNSTELKSVAFLDWVKFDATKIVENEVEILLQINSKIKGKMRVAAGLETNALEKIALENEIINQNVQGKEIKKIISVKDKLVNIIL